MTHLIEIKNVDFLIPDHDLPILSHISLNIQKGEVIAIVGGNGSGKSSLLKMIAGIYKPTHGHIECHFPTQNLQMLTQDIENCLFLDLTVFENCILRKLSKQKKLDLLHIPKSQEQEQFKTYLAEYHPKLPNKLNQKVRLLSGGERQVLALALSFFYPPDLLLLDEHTSALDAHRAQEVMVQTQKQIQKYGVTCLMVTHNLSHSMRFAQKIIILREGRVVSIVDKSQQEFQEQELYKLALV